MNKNELILKIKTLQEIKPRKEWVDLLKSQILSDGNKVSIKVLKGIDLKVPVKQPKPVGILDVLSIVFAPRKLAYAFTAAVFVIVGLLGFASYTMPGDLLFPIKKIAEHSQAALTGQKSLDNNIASFNNRINDLAQVAKDGRSENIPSAISEINANALQLVKNLKDNKVNDPQTIKIIANSLKTLASVPGADLTANSDVKDLFQTIIQSQIEDLETATLTESQQTALDEAEELYNQERYNDALQKIWELSNIIN